MLGQLIISGLALGSVYALLALAMVLIHKSTDVINFAQGEMATLSTFLALALLTATGLPLIAILLLSLLIGAALGGLTERIAIRWLADAPPVNVLIVTIGLWIIFHHTSGWIWGYDPYNFPSLLPQTPVEIAGITVAPNSLAIMGVSFSLMLALYLFFEYTREGIAMRATSMNPRAAQLMGVRVSRITMLSWAVAGAISAAAGVLVAPILFLDFEMMVGVLLKAFAGAILGGFNSLPGAVVGGLFIGVAENLLGGYVSSAFKDSFSFLLIIAVLMIRPSGLFGRSGPKKV